MGYFRGFYNISDIIENSRSGFLKYKLAWFNEADHQLCHFGGQISRGLFHKGCIAACQIQHSGLVAEDHPVCFDGSPQTQMEGVPPVCVGNGANHGKAADPVE